MHNYSITNTKIRITTVSILAIISAYFTFILNPAIALLPISLQPLSPFAAFGVIFFIFNNWIWKILPLSRLLSIPNFNGTWKGRCCTQYEGRNLTIPVTLKIKQSFTQLIVDAGFGASCSESLVANVDNINPFRAKLV